MPSNQGCFVPCFVEIGPLVLEKEIFKYFQYNFTISLLSPLGEERGPSFKQTWIPSIHGCFVPCLVEIGPVVLEKKLKMWKVYRQTDRQTDDRQQAIRKAHVSFQLRWAKKNYVAKVIHIGTTSKLKVNRCIRLLKGT